jgi:hypothetical protein
MEVALLDAYQCRGYNIIIIFYLPYIMQALDWC